MSMTYVFDKIDKEFLLDEGYINSIVIENQKLFSEVITDIFNGQEGLDCISKLFKDNNIVPFSQNADLLTSFVPFEINRKPLLQKIISSLEKNAVSPENYYETMDLLSTIEKYLDKIAFDYPCNLCFTKLNISSVIKASGLEIYDDYSSLAEKIIDYFELVTEFDSRKVFFTVNLRSYMSDYDTELFFNTSLDHGFNVIMIENKEYPKVTREKRVIVDNDLCIIA